MNHIFFKTVFLLIIFISSFSSSYALVSITSRIPTKYNTKVATTLPHSSTFRLAGSRSKDVHFWTQVLDKRDRNKDTYLVLPSNGLVIPVNSLTPGTSDYNNMVAGKVIDDNKYLQTGALHYAGTGIRGYGQAGNPVIFGHSSYWKNDAGRYKTHFGKIIELEQGEEVWVFDKNISGNYIRYRYKIQKSYNTPETDTSVLHDSQDKLITLLTCTPIGGVTGRWVIQAKYIEEEQIQQPVFTDISYKYKQIVQIAFHKISKQENARDLFSDINDKLLTLLQNGDASQMKQQRLLRFIKYRVDKELAKL